VLFGAFRSAPFGWLGVLGLRTHRAGLAGLLTSGRIYPTGHHGRRETPRSGPWCKPQESRLAPRGAGLPDRAAMPWSAARPTSPRTGVKSAGRKGPGSRTHGERRVLWRGAEAHESIGFGELRPAEVRIFAGRKALKLRGMVTFWSSEQEHAMPETTRGHRRRKTCGSVEGKGSGG
jgi:hypothetical protein